MVAMEFTAEVDTDAQGPGHVFLPFLVMEVMIMMIMTMMLMMMMIMKDLLDKLKLLDYDIQFVSELKMRPLNRHYFVIQVRDKTGSVHLYCIENLFSITHL